MTNPQDLHHPTLILIRGLPGSGKSYLAGALVRVLGPENVLILDPDKIDLASQAFLDFSKAKTAEGIDEKFHPYRWSREQAYQAIENNKVIIWNQGFTNLDGFNKTIINLQGYAKDHNTHLPLLVVEVEVNHSVAKERIAERAAQGGHDVSEENFTRFINDYRSFANEGFNTITVNGEDDATVSVTAVIKALQALWQK